MKDYKDKYNMSLFHVDLFFFLSQMVFMHHSHYASVQMCELTFWPSLSVSYKVNMLDQVQNHVADL